MWNKATTTMQIMIKPACGETIVNMLVWVDEKSKKGTHYMLDQE